MLKSDRWVRDTTRPDYPIYLGREGGVLFVAADGVGRVYDSSLEFEQFYTRVMAEPEVRSAIDGKWHHNVPDDVPMLVANLERALGGEGRHLDYSLESLQVLDARVLGRPPSKRWALFEPTVAYVGEVIRRAVPGVWWQAWESYGVREPWLNDARGRRFAPFMLVLEEFERGKRGSIRGAVSGAVRSSPG
jgi:hypothetical protein